MDRLIEAAGRGVRVRVAGLPSRAAERLEPAGDAVEQVERPWDPTSVPLSTVLIVDGERSLVTLDRADPFALWSADEPNTLLVLLRAVLGLPE